jgi:hypothetical protein
MENIRIRDGKTSDPGPGINIPDPQHYMKGMVPVGNFAKANVNQSNLLRPKFLYG